MLSRETVYFASEKDAATFSLDSDRPSLPLPKLSDTMERYYESLKPFGTTEELLNSRKIIDNFQNGIGKQLNAVLEKRAKTHKNWVEKWWEDYAYLSDRTPIIPFAAMAQPLIVESVGIDTNHANRLKTAARLIYHSIEFSDLLRHERIKPVANADGSIILSSDLFRRFSNTVRKPGKLMDTIETYFKTKTEGVSPTNFIIIGKGRIFNIEVVRSDGTLLSAVEIYQILQRIESMLKDEPEKYPVAVLTCDDRLRWAENRDYLKELSQKNAKSLDIIEKSMMVLSFDSNSPATWGEISQKVLCGDLENKWADKSSCMVVFENGKFGFTGEHSCYDGSISVFISTYLLMSLIECPEPDWNEICTKPLSIEEVLFDLDEHLINEIHKTFVTVNENKLSLIVSTHNFSHYGKEYIKSQRLHPDAYIQMVLQLTYYKLHKEFVATYETALMRQFYNGRTETVRSCTIDAVNWVKIFENPDETTENKIKMLRKAVETHVKIMNSARKGDGIDRHLFGLWCVAFEENLEVPALYNDPLYSRSGGGGNFVLSTSTLGFTINNGFVGPMLLDGYGVFYTIPNESIWMNLATFRASTKTSAFKFAKLFDETMLEVQVLLDSETKPKL